MEKDIINLSSIDGYCVFVSVYNCLTNRFHVAVRLFSNRSQMTSKCGKNKKVAHEAIAECVTDVYDVIYTSLLQLIIGMNKS